MGLKLHYAVGLKITDNGTVNIELFRNGEFVGTDELTNEEKELIRGELQFAIDEMLQPHPIKLIPTVPV